MEGNIWVSGTSLRQEQVQEEIQQSIQKMEHQLIMIMMKK